MYMELSAFIKDNKLKMGISIAILSLIAINFNIIYVEIVIFSPGIRKHLFQKDDVDRDILIMIANRAKIMPPPEGYEILTNCYESLIRSKDSKKLKNKDKRIFRITFSAYQTIRSNNYSEFVELERNYLENERRIFE